MHVLYNSNAAAGKKRETQEARYVSVSRATVKQAAPHMTSTEALEIHVANAVSGGCNQPCTVLREEHILDVISGF